MPQSLPMQPGIGFPPDSQTDLLRKLVWNTWFIGGGGGGGGGGPLFRVAVPSASTDPGNPNDVAWDGDYWYAYVTGVGWRRTPISDW